MGIMPERNEPNEIIKKVIEDQIIGGSDFKLQRTNERIELKNLLAEHPGHGFMVLR